MSKKSKALQKLKRLSKKRAQKALNKSIFAERARLGQNTLSFRAKKNNKKAKRRHGISHPEGPCGNVGCKRCDPGNIHHHENKSLRRNTSTSKVRQSPVR